jgi:hypothetical protein
MLNKTKRNTVSNLMQPGPPTPSGDAPPSEQKSGNTDMITQDGSPGAHKIASSILRFTIGVVSIAAAIIGAVTFAFGIFECLKLAAKLIAESASSTGHSDLHKEALFGIINCSEIFIAAPLPYLIVTAVFHYIRDWVKKDTHDSAVQEKLHEGKMFLFGLLLSLITIDLVSRLIGAQPPPGRLVAYLLATIVVIAGYLLCAEFLKRRGK